MAIARVCRSRRCNGTCPKSDGNCLHFGVSDCRNCFSIASARAPFPKYDYKFQPYSLFTWQPLRLDVFRLITKKKKNWGIRKTTAL